MTCPEVLVLALALGCVWAATPAVEGEMATLTPGRTHEVFTTAQGEVRYTVHVPAEHAARPPLVLALHYAGHGEPYYGEGVLDALVEPGLRPLDAVLVAPDCPGASQAVPWLRQVWANPWRGEPPSGPSSVVPVY